MDFALIFLNVWCFGTYHPLYAKCSPGFRKKIYSSGLWITGMVWRYAQMADASSSVIIGAGTMGNLNGVLSGFMENSTYFRDFSLD